MFKVRPIENGECFFLKEMMYLTLYTPPGAAAFPKEVLYKPEVRKYYEHWGKPGDMALVVVETKGNKPVGAAWARLHTVDKAGYGFVREDIPELDLAVKPEFRGKKLGTLLLREFIQSAKIINCPGLSLSVDFRNPAKKLYERFGFKTVSEQGNPVMLLEF